MLKQPSPRTETRLQLAFVMIILGLFIVEIVRDFEPIKITALFCVVFWIPLLALHEFGHAIVARLFDCHVCRVVIGYGKPASIFPLGGIPIELRRFPIEGFVRFHAQPGLARWKRALIYFAGPGIELALLMGIAGIVGIDTMLTQSESIPILAVQSLGVCIIMSALMNLIPHSSGGTEGNRSPNDGLGIVLSVLGRLDD